jgi:ATP/maltotriose-dependent transcriptional regulator MalT
MRVTAQQRQMIRNAYFCESPETLQSAIEQAQRAGQPDKVAILQELKEEIEAEENYSQ